jgi:hypothetical protein
MCRSSAVERRRSRRLRFPFLLALALITAIGSRPVHAEADLDHIVRCMRDNAPKSLHAEVDLVAVDRGGHAQALHGTLDAESTEQEGRRLVWRLQAPPDLAGTALLTRDDPQGLRSFLYLPALGRVRRIEQADREGRMFGTDLSYGDAERIASVFTEGALTVLGESRYGQRPAWKLAATATPGGAGAYDRIDIVIDQQSCVTVQAELLREGVARKRWSVAPDALRQSGPYWYAADGLMRDLQQGTQTRVHLSDVSSDRHFADATFDPQRFYRGH